MRVLLLFAAIVVLLAFVGWVTFSAGPGRSSVNVETDEIRRDTQEVLESGAEALRKAENAVAPADEDHRQQPTPGQ